MRYYPLAKGLRLEYLLEGQRRLSLTIQEGRPSPGAALLLQRSCFQRASTSEAFSRSTSDGFGLRDGTGSTIAKGFGEAGAAGAAPRTWASFQAKIADSEKYRRAPMINGRGKLSSRRMTQLKIVRGATLNSLATAGLVISLSGWSNI
jgi:hypothetical protein